MEAIVGWFASPAFAKVLEKAQKYLEANYKFQKDAKEMFGELTHNLLFCQATVKEVEKGASINNPAIEKLLLHFKMVVRDAERYLDNMEATYIKEEGQGKNKVYRFVSSFRDTLFLQADLRSLKKIGDRLKKLCTDIPTLLDLVNINKDNESHTHEVTDQRKTIFQLLKEDLYSKDLDTLCSYGFPLWLARKYSPYYLDFSIVGMGGVGKTAVPHAVYNNPEVQQTFESKGSRGVRCPYWPSEPKESEGVRCPYWPSESKGSGGVRCPYCSSDKTQFDWESKLFDSEFPFLHSTAEFDGIPSNHPWSFPIKSEFQFFHASLSLSFLFLALCERWRKLERILTAEMVSPHPPASPPTTPMTSTASSCSASSTSPAMSTTSTTSTSPITAASAISVSVI